MVMLNVLNLLVKKVEKLLAVQGDLIYHQIQIEFEILQIFLKKNEY